MLKKCYIPTIYVIVSNLNLKQKFLVGLKKLFSLYFIVIKKNKKIIFISCSLLLLNFVYNSRSLIYAIRFYVNIGIIPFSNINSMRIIRELY